MPPTMTIGTVARAAGVSVDTVRFYERRRLLPVPARRASGYRHYTAATVDRIRFAKGLQRLGLTLDEVTELLGDVDAGIASCARETPRFTRVLARVDAEIAGLVALRRELRTTLRRCGEGRCSLGGRVSPRGSRTPP
jgi:DNA-binding transcriptional MerR regulator